MKKEKYAQFLGLLIGFFVALVIPFVSHYVSFGTIHTITFEYYLRSFILNVIVGFFVGSWIPAVQWGEWIADILHIHHKIMRYFVSIFILAVVMVAMMCGILIFIDMGFQNQYWSVLLYTYPRMLIGAYPLLLIAVMLGERVAKKVCVK
ncbi:MAG: hypothetical protein ACI4SR_09505 [Faecalibacillus sp.]